MTNEEILRGIAEIVNEVAGVETSEITPEKSFVDELLVNRKLSKRNREQRRMREDVHRHLGCEALEIVDVKFHVHGRRDLRRNVSLKHGEWSARTRDVRSVERAETMGEARREIAGELAPERIVPAELAAAQHVVTIELVEVLANRVDAVQRAADVARAVVGDARPDAARCHLGDELLDGEHAVGEDGVRVIIDEHRASLRHCDER